MTMTPERLEQFRRKLREGEEVRVVNGHVELVSEPAQVQAQPRINAWGQVEPAAPPIMVKPHEWGSQPFYLEPGGQQRAMQEQDLLRRYFPGFELQVDDDGTPFVHGWIGPNDRLHRRYHVLATLPPGYGRGAMPQVWVLEPALEEDSPHRYSDGSLCLDHSGAFTDRSTVVTFLAWVSVWLVLYEGWMETDEVW